MQVALSRRSMKTAKIRWFVVALSPEAAKHLASLKDPPAIKLNEDDKVVKSMFGIWECLPEQIDAMSAEPLSKNLYFERLFQREESSHPEPFHVK